MHFLSKPFPPLSSKRQRFISAVLFGAFVFVFLQVFKPFGISEIRGQVWMVTLGYGLITFLAIIIVQFWFVMLFPNFYNEDHWTIGKDILHTLLIVVLVAAGNIFFTASLGFMPLSWPSFLLFLGFTIAVGIFPVTIQAFIRMSVVQRRNLKKSIEMTDELHHRPPLQHSSPEITLTDEDGRSALMVNPEDILALESADNYVEVYYLSEGKLKSALVRNALKNYEDQLSENADFFRCHRSFIINLRNVQKVEGNARGYHLLLHEDMKAVPVARRRVEEFLKFL